MASISPDELGRARQALDKLVQTYIHHPDVSLIDMGLDTDPQGGERVVLRVHVRGAVSGQSLALPAQVDGFPVLRLSGDYKPEG